MRYVVLLRGINVGGRNKVPMAGLNALLSEEYDDVRTYIQSGNVLLTSDRSAQEVADHVESALPKAFALDSDLVRTLVLARPTYLEVVDQAPAGFGSEPDTYRYDVGFFVGIDADAVRPHLPTNPEVDTVDFGEHAFYHRRLTAMASRSRLNKVVGTPAYASLTIRNWRTTTTLAAMLEEPPRVEP